METLTNNIISMTYKSGKRIEKYTPEDFGMYVVTGPQQGVFDNSRRIGKVVQVRLEDGAYGSDMVFLRHCDGSLWMHENQSFYKVPDECKLEVEELFSGNTAVDSPKDTYSKNGKFKRKGFIIPSKVKPGETTPMRSIKSKIINAIEKIQQ